ncbi:hypothetical protein [Mesorhizobium abyssinicae]|uniref:hypothetical protein n=1 Tax=Mesorhizobium abyssinicae TaxID=1209958 RepID=UPI00387DD450
MSQRNLAGTVRSSLRQAVRNKRGHRVAAVALARKLAVLIWHLPTKQEDYLW